MKLLVFIGHGMNPNYGVIDGYMFETFENGTPYAYIILMNIEESK